MKKEHVFMGICGVVLMTFLSCKKKSDDKLPSYPLPDYGIVTALRNGVPWAASITCGNTSDTQKTFGVLIRTYSPEGFDREHLGFGNIPFQTFSDAVTTGWYNDSSRQVHSSGIYTEYYQSFADGDAVTPRFILLDDKPHKLTIESYDSVAKLITGTFEVGFIDYHTDQTNDTALFTNGHFFTKIQRYQVP